VPADASVDQAEALCTQLKGIVEVLAPGCRIMPNAGPPRRCRNMLSHRESLRFDMHAPSHIFKGAMIALWEL
jgi:hypothetical protein